MKKYPGKEDLELRQWSIMLEAMAVIIAFFHFFTDMASKALPFLGVATLFVSSFFHFLRYRKSGATMSLINSVIICMLGIYFLSMTIIIQFL